jgi:hypothetical protein
VNGPFSPRRLSWVAWKNNYESLGLYDEQSHCFKEERIAASWDSAHRLPELLQVLVLGLALGVVLTLAGLFYQCAVGRRPLIGRGIGWWILALLVLVAAEVRVRAGAKLKLVILDYLYGFGEEPQKVFWNAVAVVFLFAGAYHFACSGCDRLGTLGPPGHPRAGGGGSQLTFMEFLYFSIVTFTTLGDGNLTPRGFCSVLSAFESLLGLVMAALFIHALARRTAGR